MSLPRSSAGGYTVGTVVDGGLDAAMRAVEAADATIRGTVERSVETAYQVIEEYMLRGRQAAGRHHETRNGRDRMSDDTSNGHGQRPGGIGFDPMQPWMQMMRLWTDTMTTMMPAAAAMMPTNLMSQFMPGAAPFANAYQRAKLSVSVTSENPVEVSVDLDPGAEYASLTVDPLARAESGAPKIASTSVACDAGRVTLRVTVPKDQPSGRYTGAVLDATGTRRGEVTVVVTERAGAPPRAKRARKA